MKYKLLKDLPNAKAGEYKLDKSKLFEIILTNGDHSFNIFQSWLDNKEWFEEIKEVKSIYDLKEGDEYYSVVPTGINKLIYRGVNGIDEIIINSGSAFLTEEEVETEVRKRKARATIEKWSYDNDGGYEWNYDELNCYIYYCNILRKLDYNNDRNGMSGLMIYYSSKKIIRKAMIELEAEYKTLFDITK